MGKDNMTVPPWAEEMNEGYFVSAAPTYEVGKYFHLFDRAVYKDRSGTELKYYYFEPDVNPEDKQPLLVFVHGTGNSLVGDTCINYAGAEFYATEKYQKNMGGAYVLVPVANERTGDDGKTVGSWDTAYLEPVHALIMEFISQRKEHIGPIFLFGNSSGATFVMRLMDNYMDDFDVVIPVGSSSLPDDSILDEYEKKGKTLFFAIGKRDEFHSFEDEVAPRLPKLEKMKNCFIYTPEWVRNGDKGVASINVGIEMGQHCLVNGVHINLMFDDGTPMDERLPNGMTGWIAQTAEGYKIWNR